MYQPETNISYLEVKSRSTIVSLVFGNTVLNVSAQVSVVRESKQELQMLERRRQMILTDMTVAEPPVKEPLIPSSLHKVSVTFKKRASLPDTRNDF